MSIPKRYVEVSCSRVLSCSILLLKFSSVHDFHWLLFCACWTDRFWRNVLPCSKTKLWHLYGVPLKVQTCWPRNLDKCWNWNKGSLSPNIWTLKLVVLNSELTSYEEFRADRTNCSTSQLGSIIEKIFQCHLYLWWVVLIPGIHENW